MVCAAAKRVRRTYLTCDWICNYQSLSLSLSLSLLLILLLLVWDLETDRVKERKCFFVLFIYYFPFFSGDEETERSRLQKGRCYWARPGRMDGIVGHGPYMSPWHLALWLRSIFPSLLLPPLHSPLPLFVY